MRRKLMATLAAFVLVLTGAAPGIARSAPAPSGGADRAPVAAPLSPVDQTKVPHYFGPYPNWANSPLTQPDATVTITAGSLPVTPIAVGNAVTAREFASDDTINTGSNTPGQGTVLVVLPNALPAGTHHGLPDLHREPAGSRAAVAGQHLQRVRAAPDGDHRPVRHRVRQRAADGPGRGRWRAYVARLGARPARRPDRLLRAGHPGRPDRHGPGGAIPSPLRRPARSTRHALPHDRRAGPIRSARRSSRRAVPAAGAGATAEATVGANGAVTGLTITNPGHDYASATVAITGAGSGATASADVQTSGAVTGIAVDQAGSGYTAPSVTITGGGATTDATAHALGGVDGVTLSVEGAAYSFPTVDFDLPDDPAGIQAQGHATCAAPYPDCTERS